MNSLDFIFIDNTKKWLEKFVIGLNLCPFAKKPFVADKIRYVVYHGLDMQELLNLVTEEIRHLDDHPDSETTLIILTQALADFLDYYDFYELLELGIEELEYDGIYQIATFHPAFQFSGTNYDDVENFTNRSPFPIFHLLREDSITKAVDGYKDVEKIPEMNIAKMNELGTTKVKQLMDEINRSN